MPLDLVQAYQAVFAFALGLWQRFLCVKRRAKKEGSAGETECGGQRPEPAPVE